MSAFVALAADAVRDVARRPSLVVAALASGVAALAVHRCSGCHISVFHGNAAGGEAIGALATLASFGLMTVWTYALGALLASDGLATALEDGTAEWVLARPVSRDVFCLARLAGTLAASLAVGLLLLAAAASTLYFRQGLPVAPVTLTACAVALGTWSTAALAMALSLWLPRPAALLAMTVIGAALCGADLASWLGHDAGGGLWSLAGRYGPGWLSVPLAPLAAAWIGPAAAPMPTLGLLRAAAWSGIATAALVLAFRRLELPR